MAEYREESLMFRALSVPMRLQILDMLSCGEMCACDLLEHLPITQSTLSHHMKALVESGLIVARRSASWTYYSIDLHRVEELNRIIEYLTQPKASCSCMAAQAECPEGGNEP